MKRSLGKFLSALLVVCLTMGGIGSSSVYASYEDGLEVVYGDDAVQTEGQEIFLSDDVYPEEISDEPSDETESGESAGSAEVEVTSDPAPSDEEEPVQTEEEPMQTEEEPVQAEEESMQTEEEPALPDDEQEFNDNEPVMPDDGTELPYSDEINDADAVEDEAVYPEYSAAEDDVQDEGDTYYDVLPIGAPVLKGVEVSSSGITVSWTAAENTGTACFGVFRKAGSDAAWQLIGITEAGDYEYTDTGAVAGITYYYTVRAYSGDPDNAYSDTDYDSGNSMWSFCDTEGIMGRFIDTPVMNTTVTALASGTNITWSPVSGASGYEILRKPSGGEWTAVGTASSAEYTDTDTTGRTSGNTYYYTVRAYMGSKEEADEHINDPLYWSGYDETGVEAIYLANPKLNEVIVNAKGEEISWGSVLGAYGYAVYRRESGGSWSMIDTTTDTSYIDSSTGKTSGKTYEYTVRAYKGSVTTAKNNQDSAKYWGGYDSSGTGSVYLTVPSLQSATAESKGVQISWSKVTGATGYAVYRKVSGGSWAMIDTTTSTSYTDTDTSGRTSGKTYVYTVRAYYGDVTAAKNNRYNSLYWGGYNSSGVSAVYLSTPKLNKVTINAKGEEISWGSVSGASGYAVYRRVSGGGWSMIDTTTDTSYIDSSTGKTSGKTYEYTVRAYTGSVTTAKNNRYSAKYWSGFDSSGTGSVYLTVPSLQSATAESGGVKISWSKVSGATGYAVYRKVSGGSWAMIDTTTSTSYTDTDTSGRTSGKTYIYTVRAYYGNVTTAKNNRYNSLYWGGYNSSGISSIYLTTPKLSSVVTAEASGRKISWNSVSGATGYAVYRKVSGGGWSMIGTTTDTSYTDKASLTSGSTYYYTVRAYKGSETTAKNNRYSASYWSGFNSSGVKAVYLSNPSLSSVSVGTSSNTVSWGKVTGASGYAVYRKPDGGSWSMIGTTTSTSYKDTDSLSSTKVYYYTVRAYYGNVSTAKNNRYNALYWSGYDSKGLVTIENAAMNNKAQSYSSNTNYLIMVDCTLNRIGIYTGSKGNWTRKYYWECTTGAASTPTPTGSYTVGSKGKSFSGSYYTCWYYTQFSGNYLFHSVLYDKDSMTSIYDGELGVNKSHGCVRLSMENAKWIYDNIPAGTKVIIY